MKTAYYIKKGRRYEPVMEYDSELSHAFPYGAHLVMSKPGMQSRKYNIDPALAPLIAAAFYARDAMTTAVYEASHIRPGTKPITEEQRAAWEQLKVAFGDERYHLTWPSAADVVDVGLKAMEEEAAKMLENPAVKKAYERFLMIVELTREHKDEE